jgi:malate dehydrogenase
LPFACWAQIKLGPKGVEEVYGLGDLTESEKAAVEALKPELKASIEKGVAFAAARE